MNIPIKLSTALISLCLVAGCNDQHSIFLNDLQEYYQCEYDVKKTYYLANKKTLDVKDEVVELIFMSWC